MHCGTFWAENWASTGVQNSSSKKANNKEIRYVYNMGFGSLAVVCPPVTTACCRTLTLHIYTINGYSLLRIIVYNRMIVVISSKVRRVQRVLILICFVNEMILLSSWTSYIKSLKLTGT